MLLDPDSVERGSRRALESAEYVAEATKRLDRAEIESGLFGAMSTGGDAVSLMRDVHANHSQGLRAHAEAVGAIASHATSTAASIQAQDQANRQGISETGLR
ncbi:hypothetical protein GCM10027169_15950 [Gordonia jinhuaensis]|uniref:Uncharacterized protein n=1 Tax=Gordonia jinhuaensis TaxID=1517702 RepID=A0A916X1T5_9ACTN|nr:DUF2563 family protein [Gordonia jinhuaensis]GGB48774.1 hypothetical protein GCM10011489_39830 [Gordonia jinhuaensis]